MYSVLRSTNKSKVVLLFLTLVFISGCAHFAKTKVGRFYHNTTSRYNGYFNANEKIIAAQLAVDQAHVNDFSLVLDVLHLGTEETGKSLASEMDAATEKCTRVIQRHPLSNWVDDSYFVIGKAYFYKAQYYEALDLLQYLATEYKEKYMGYEAQLWIIKCYSQLGKQEDALAYLSILYADKKFPKELFPQRELLNAHVKVKMHNYQDAIKSLEKAIPEAKKKTERFRLRYILAQLYEEVGNRQRAHLQLESLKNKNMPYEFQFQIRLGLAKNANLTTKSSTEKVIKSFKKLIKDDNNRDYYDQIYFEIGNIYLRARQPDNAILNYQKSAFLSKTNMSQKATTYYTLGDIYFKNHQYTEAGAYYDSCAAVVPTNHPKYEEIKRQQSTLSALITNLQTIRLQDSLQSLSKLSSSELEKKINEVIANEKKAEELAKIKEEKQKERAALAEENKSSIDNGMIASSKNADWYFYNPATIGAGFTDFKRKWGTRPLEDNWRRSQKTPVFNNIDEPDIDEPDNTDEKDSNEVAENETQPDQLANVDEAKKKYYLEIPFIQSQMRASDDKILDAIFGNGLIYYEKLSNLPLALRSFSKILERYPESKYEIPAEYYLHKVYAATGDSVKALAFKNKILSEHPTSEYARLLAGKQSLFKDNYNSSLEDYYKQTVALLDLDACDSVVARAYLVDKKFSNNYLKPQFDYIRTVCQGKKSTPEQFIASLEVLVSAYAGTDISLQSKNLIRYLNSKNKKIKTTDTTTKEGVMLSKDTVGEPAKKEFIYTFSEEGNFIFSLVVDRKGINNDKVQVQLSNYNYTYHRSQNLQSRSFVLNDNEQLFMVKGLKSLDEAVRYLKGISTDAEFKTNSGITTFSMFYITEANFRIMVKEKDKSEYTEFFELYYLKNAEN